MPVPPTGVCDTDNIAAPWDPVFLAQWDSMLAAVSAHLKAAGTYNAIHACPPSPESTEPPRSCGSPPRPPPPPASLASSDSIATWQQAGYLPSRLLQGWNALLASFRKSFPDKSFAASIIPNDAFPGIAQDGSIIKGQIGDEDEPLLMSAAQQLPGRLVVQFDFLMPGEAAASVVTGAAQNYGTFAAFQTNEYLGGRA